MNGERPEPHENIDERQFVEMRDQEANELICYYGADDNCFGNITYDHSSGKYLCAKCAGLTNESKDGELESGGNNDWLHL